MSYRYYDAGYPHVEGQQKVFLATPSYDDPDCSYTFSIARSREALTAAGIASAYYLLQGNAHVDDSRNSIVRDFLLSDCTDLVFLDADVSWEPDRLIKLCQFNRDIVGGVYPYRREGAEEKMPVRLLSGEQQAEADGCLEVEGLPTGFMRIKRHVIETMVITAKHFRKDEDTPIPVLFERDYFGGGRRGGDIRFCMVWREMGGKVYAAPELRLGHCGKHVLKDSLAASLRRQNKLSLSYIARSIRDGDATLDTYVEATEVVSNYWGAEADVLQVAGGLARSSALPILEIGSGLSTVILAAANPGQTVWCIEHDASFARKTEAMLELAGLTNVAMVTAPLENGWYDLKDDMALMPEKFGFAFVDGPPRDIGDRMQFFNAFGDRSAIILCDDAKDIGYAAKLQTWAKSRGRELKIDGRAGVLLAPSDGW